MSFDPYMRGVAGAVLLAAVVGSPVVPTFAGPREEAVMVVERWLDAFTASDVNTIVELYAADATFIGTSSRTVLTASADIRRYFERALQSNRPRGATLGEHVVAELGDGTVLVTGLDTMTSVRAGEPVSTPGARDVRHRETRRQLAHRPLSSLRAAELGTRLPMQLVMFDIDGTLVDTAGLDGDLYAAVVRSVLGVEVDPTWASYTHVTDSGVLEEVLRGGDYGARAAELRAAVASRFVAATRAYLERHECDPGGQRCGAAHRAA